MAVSSGRACGSALPAEAAADRPDRARRRRARARPPPSATWPVQDVEVAHRAEELSEPAELGAQRLRPARDRRASRPPGGAPVPAASPLWPGGRPRGPRRAGPPDRSSSSARYWATSSERRRSIGSSPVGLGAGRGRPRAPGRAPASASRPSVARPPCAAPSRSPRAPSPASDRLGLELGEPSADPRAVEDSDRVEHDLDPVGAACDHGDLPPGAEPGHGSSVAPPRSSAGRRSSRTRRARGSGRRAPRARSGRPRTGSFSCQRPTRCSTRRRSVIPQARSRSVRRCRSRSR